VHDIYGEDEEISVDVLIELQRRLSHSKNPFERVVGSLCIAAILKEQLVGLPNSTIGRLMTDYVYSGLNLLGPESVIVEIASERAPRISYCDCSEGSQRREVRDIAGLPRMRCRVLEGG
jgi:hypothetical protein